jgi:putative membrane protein
MILAFWGVLIVLAVAFLRARCTRRGHGPRLDEAQEILRARYAKGEITRDEFEAMRRDLQAV